MPRLQILLPFSSAAQIDGLANVQKLLFSVYLYLAYFATMDPNMLCLGARGLNMQAFLLCFCYA
jgi:hypothetical protein